MIGMELDQIRRCPQVIALAGGVDKENAIRGALQGDYIDVMITDFPTARALIKGQAGVKTGVPGAQASPVRPR